MTDCTTVRYLKVGDVGRKVRVAIGESLIVGPLREVSVVESTDAIWKTLAREYGKPLPITTRLKVGGYDLTVSPNTPIDFLEDEEND